MPDASTIKKRFLEKFTSKIIPALQPSDHVLISGHMDTMLIFYILTNQALFILVGRTRHPTLTEEFLETIPLGNRVIDANKMVKVDEIFESLIKVYQSNGSFTLPPDQAKISMCFMFPTITKNTKKEEITGIWHYLIKQPLHTAVKTTPPLTKQIKWLINQKLTQLQQLQEQDCKELVKELLLELEPNDTVAMNDAISSVKKESNYLDEQMIEEVLSSVAVNLSQFKFIRLTNTIKRLDANSTDLGREIDTLLNTFDEKKVGKDP